MIYTGQIRPIQGVTQDPATGYWSGPAGGIVYEVSYTNEEGQLIQFQGQPNQARFPNELEIFAAQGACVVHVISGATTFTCQELPAIAPCDEGA